MISSTLLNAYILVGCSQYCLHVRLQEKMELLAVAWALDVALLRPWLAAKRCVELSHLTLRTALCTP